MLKGLRRPTSEKTGEESDKVDEKDLKSKLGDFKVQANNEQENLSHSKVPPKKFSKQEKRSSLRASSLRQNLKSTGLKPELGTVLNLLGEKREKSQTKETAKEQKEPSGEDIKVKRIDSRPKWLGNEFSHQDLVDKKYNKILRELQDDASERKLSSGGSSGLLESLKSVEESGQDDVNNFLEKSLEETRSRKRKKLRETLLSSKTKSLSQKPERKWVERNLEDLEKNLNKVEPSQTKADPELNNKIKDILSELKVAPQQLGTAKTIVAAVENWGKTSFNLSQHIMDEYNEQTEESHTTLAEFSLKEGNRLTLFDNILQEAKAKNLTIHPSEDAFLMQSDYLEEADKIHSIGVYQNAFRDEINLSNRLWQYPIDNEACKVEEQGVSFEEHIFLEYLLDDFPRKGPVRRFMELVISGLQKNPHLSVEMKKERVSWFKDYFANFTEEELNF